MGSFIAKQPNGLYCRFSTVVDCPTEWNMTENDYIELCAEKARKEAREVLEKHLQPFDMIKEYFYPNNMTEDEFKEFLKETSKEIEASAENKEDIMERIIFPNRGRAESALDKMEQIIELYGCATRADLYDISGFNKTPRDQKFGWNDLKSATVAYDSTVERYVLTLPRALRLE